MKRLYAILAVLLLINTACGSGAAQQSNKMPKEMPKDFNFLVRYGYGTVTKNEINTYWDTVTKDLVVDGTASASLTFTSEELNQIYEKMREIDIMGKKKLSANKSGCRVTPYKEDSWKVTIDGTTKAFNWSEKNCYLTDDAKQLLELRTYIQQMVEGKDEYKQLPPARGGYD